MVIISSILSRYSSLTLVFFIYFFIIIHFCVYAWDSDGHQVIGMTIMSALNPKTASTVKRMMGGNDIVDISSWGNQVAAQYPETEPLHFLYQPTKFECGKAVITDKNCPNNICLVKALQHFYGRLSGQPNLVKLEYPSGLTLTDSDALRYFVHLLGDLHHPLHVGFQEDLGGKNISVIYRNDKNDKVTTTLFQYWDSDLIQKIIHQRPGYWYGGWTYAHSLGPLFNNLQKEWDDYPQDTRHELFEAWATDSLSKACSHVYKHMHTGAVIVSGFEASGVYELDVFYSFLKNQILIAGARIAIILNSLLQDRDGVKLRQGSGVELKLESHTPIKGLPVHSGTYIRSACINGLIIFVVLGVLGYIGRYYTPGATVPGISVGVGSSGTIKGSTNFGKQVEKRS